MVRRSAELEGQSSPRARKIAARPGGSGFELLLLDKILCAASAADAVGFGRPSDDVTRAVLNLLHGSFSGHPQGLNDASVFFGPDGGGNVVFSWDSAEADITVRPDGNTFHVSLLDKSTGVVREEVLSSPAAVNERLVRAM